jgi:hypothetical protein
MRLDEARGLLMQALREKGWKSAGDLVRNIGILKARATGQNPNEPERYYGAEKYLDPGDAELINEVIWSLIIQGVLVPGFNDANLNWPFLRLSEYGKRCVAEDRILPHDPDGFLKEFHKDVPDADPSVAEYLEESLQCYIRGLNKASAVMLGAASEQAVLLLIDSCKESISDQREKERFESTLADAKTLSRKYEVFRKRLATLTKALRPSGLAENLDSLLTGVFDLVRNTRNDAGHPARGKDVDRDAMYSHLRLFVPYTQRIFGLIKWFSENQT